ncbi:uncharacterized protein LOC133290535 isoform X3 [Gastrolobium bilobum]|uniref:uncharacterized protein LOC133290535 isoform X3 n=1 Tax=Gastrolobium bilobum TaxID=150636 RepID=UPI002AAFCE74|nr:uncharacterized protein LOC133290535 isoform X3 [Gastrolobium bilobum]
MASACVNNIGMSPENFPSYAWLSPRVSFSHDSSGSNPSNPDPEPDFEFRLEDPVAMLPADQLFSDGKLVPLHLSSLKPSTAASPDTSSSPENSKSYRRIVSSGKGGGSGCSGSGSDPYLFSPKAPRCSSRWKELLGLKKLYLNANGNGNGNGTSSKCDSQKTTSFSSSSTSSSTKSLKHFLHRSSSKPAPFPSENASLSLPLLKDSDCESVSMSSRLSLSSSSSGHEHDDLPRLSLDSDKSNPNHNPNPIQISIHRNPNPRVRLVKPRAGSFDNKMDQYPNNRAGRRCRGVSVDSPRMNSSGKIVFQSLERSSSSPSSFNGGPRFKHRGMERSYSANVRVTPVLNVPVCSLRGGSKSGSVFGFGQLFSSPQKKEGSVGNGGGNNKGRHRCDRN